MINEFPTRTSACITVWSALRWHKASVPPKAAFRNLISASASRTTRYGVTVEYVSMLFGIGGFYENHPHGTQQHIWRSRCLLHSCAKPVFVVVTGTSKGS